MPKNNDNLIYFTFRLNLDNPKHMKIAKVMKNLDPAVYKSINKYMAEAIEFFIDHSEEDTYINHSDAEKSKFVKRSDLDLLQELMCERAVSAAKDEIIRLLGVNGVVKVQVTEDAPKIGTDAVEAQPQTENSEVDEIVEGLALEWANKLGGA